MGLSHYQKKRNFSKTPEPTGTLKKEKPHSRIYIIQKHAASHLHYDLRLELNGVLKSWAVPKGPSLDPNVKRLAIHVEDHPIDYAHFEGIIPKGQYGGGTVMLWDRGTWESLDEKPWLAYQKGHLRFELHAEKLKGRWDLIRLKDEKQWFLIKYRDEEACDESDEEITKTLDRSVKTQRTMEEITQETEKIARKKNIKKKRENTIPPKSLSLPKNLPKTSFPTFIPPELAVLVDNPPNSAEWLHEIKFDGFRILAFKEGKKVYLKSRNNKDWTEQFKTIATEIKKLPFQRLVLDGEVVVFDQAGKSNFQLLQNSLKQGMEDYVYYTFDILYFDHYDLKNLDLLSRKAILKEVIATHSKYLRYSDHLLKEGPELFEAACQHALEGIISKNIASHYATKRTKDWLKSKCLKRQEFVIGGYTLPTGNRDYVGSLFLGVYNQKRELFYQGKVGTGFTKATLKMLYQQLSKLKSAKNPFLINPPGYKEAQWVRPQLVADVAFTEKTEKGYLRHPSFKGLRLDKKPYEVIQEIEVPLEKIKNATAQPEPTMKVKLTHPSKILYPHDKITKQDLYDYYEAISDYMLPYVSMRPLTLVRCPAHYKKCFFQRHYQSTFPNELLPIQVEDEQTEAYIYLKDQQGLLSLVQMDVLEIHPWGSVNSHLDKPDIMIFDLDPAPDVSWKEVVQAAFEIREQLQTYHLHSFVKSTGGKGLHIVIPIKPEYDWDIVKTFSHVFVEYLETINPDKYVSKMTKTKRKGKIFVDYLRNQKTATAIAPFSTRARAHATIAAPLFWDELSDRIEDNTFTLKSIMQRINSLKDDPWKDFWTIKQSLKIK